MRTNAWAELRKRHLKSLPSKPVVYTVNANLVATASDDYATITLRRAVRKMVKG